MPFNAISFGLETSDVVGLTPDQRTAVEFQATISIVSKGSQVYENFRYPRYRNFYGYCQLMSGAYVIKSVELNYLNQELLHWRDDVFGINETTGCYAKGLASALNPPFNLITKTILIRQRYTGLRFRLMPTVTANLGLVWETPAPLCGGLIEQPDDRQGAPLPPNNGNSDPSRRPPQQGGDGTDRSANDGNYDPTDGVPKPPEAGNGSVFPNWHAFGVGTLPGCATYNFNINLPAATDQAVTPGYVPTGPNAGCPGQSTDGNIVYGGATLSSPTGVVSISFSYY